MTYTFLPVKPTLFRLVLFLGIFSAFASCQKDTVTPHDPVKQAADDDALIKEYLAKDGNTAATKTPSGLYYILKTAGTDPQVKAGNTVNVHYIGRFLNGQIFESSYVNGNPFTVQVGVTNVIAGWTEGLQLMKKGEKARLYIPSGLAYGNRSTGSIPANTVLVFDLEVTEINQ